MTRRRPTIVTLLAVSGLLLGGPAGASAAERYAAPGAIATTPCTVAQPCSLNAAFKDAGTGDEVIAAPGEYPITTSLSSSATGVTLRDTDNIYGIYRERMLEAQQKHLPQFKKSMAGSA